MPISKKTRNLRKWFQRHKWHTCNTPTGSGFFAESPVMNCAGMIHFEKDTKREFSWEHYMSVELDRFNCEYLSFLIFSRKHYWKRDPRVPGNGFWYNTVPSDEFSEWDNGNEAVYMSIPARDIIRLAEMVKAAQEDWLAKRPTRKHMNFMERISKNCGVHWIGRNSSYEKIKQVFSNDRLMEERKTTDPFSWKP